MLRRCRIVVLLPTLALCSRAASEWVYFGPGHRLRYRAAERGNRIMDFSCAGLGGGMKLPDFPVVNRALANIGYPSGKQ